MNKPNPFIPPLSRDELPSFMQAAHDRALAVRGDSTFIDVMGRAPSVFAWYGNFYQRLFHGGRVPVAMKELARYRLSTLHGCAFCNKGNRLDAMAAGLTELQIAAIDNAEADCWSAVEIVVYCQSGRRANMALEALQKAGYTRLSHLEGDYPGWQSQGRPVEKGGQ